MEYKRNIELGDLLKHKSVLLLGPRATGKSTYIQTTFPDAYYYDLLDHTQLQKIIKNIHVIEEEVSGQEKLIIIDEIQKLPSMLDEVHRLIQRKKYRFILTGSSARKLKHGGANLLAGRAWECSMLPLNSREITDFDLIKYLNVGGLPAVYTSSKPKLDLKNYIGLYLQQEILAEALTRNVQAFSEFLSLAALTCGEEINFESFARDTGLSPATIKNHFQILTDTLVGVLLPGFTKTKKRKAISRSKFYFFDVGVANALCQRGEIVPHSELFGKALEHFIFMELRCYLSYTQSELQMAYWRSLSQFEVDFVVGQQVAIEVKSTKQANDNHFKGLRALKEEKIFKRYIVVSMDEKKRTTKDGIEIFPVSDFLKEMWLGKLL